MTAISVEVRTLNDYDRNDLIAHAIDPDWALANGRVYSAETAADLPDPVRPDDVPDEEYARFAKWWKRQSPCLVINHSEPVGWDGDTRTVPELKPRRETLDAESPKYVQAKWTGTARSITAEHLARARAGRHTEVWVIEGSQQAMPFQQFAPPYVVAIGMKGCAGWALKGGMLPAAIKPIVRDKIVRVLFDSDLATNHHVWTQAKRFQAAATGLGPLRSMCRSSRVPARPTSTTSSPRPIPPTEPPNSCASSPCLR